MTPRLLLHQAVLFAHVIAFAMTLSAVLREDLRWLRHRRIDAARLQHTMRVVSAGLAVLWVTGLALWALASADSPQAVAWNPKMCAKLAVVSLLTLNGWALHTCVFPGLQTAEPAARLPVVLGAFSSASWVYAAFVGVARPLAGVLSFAGFMGLYALSLGLALMLALRLSRVCVALSGSVQRHPAKTA